MDDMKKIMEQLQAPFNADEIEWRVQSCDIIKGNNKPWAIVLAYVQNRAIMNRLDDVFGIGNWKNEFVKWGENSNLCGISCKINGEWVAKWDGADKTDIEATKGGLSDSMKRSAVQWGIGRYLYNLTESFANCSTEKQNGKDWRKAKTKSNQYIYWQIPTLPDWALPVGEQTPKPQKVNNPPPKQEKPSSTDVMVKYLQEQGIDLANLESMLNCPVGDFSRNDVAMIKQALKDSKVLAMSFEDCLWNILQGSGQQQ